MTAVAFLFVPGKEWLMTTLEGDTLDDTRHEAAAFAKKYGEGKWTELRIYGTALATAIRGEVVWRS